MGIDYGTLGRNIYFYRKKRCLRRRNWRNRQIYRIIPVFARKGTIFIFLYAEGI